MCPRHRDSAHSPRKGGTQGLQNKDAICTANRNIPWSQNQQRSAHAAHPPPTRPFEHVMMDFIELHPAEDIRGQVKAALPTPAEEQLHNLKSGDYVVKDFRRTRWNQKRWQGPFQILLVTQTAVKVAERVTWIHASHCKRVPEPKEPVSRE
ncbi:hypothetical protein D4764_12G0011010 [Takifugu flavidus]|uniref:Murine leukemia virus integrase C-terminal domain-containing protein n=1 Tax=Takifugu flavidus TaxID=433684 RepID=A0A5C6PFZ7_9TELE|nr:hypothetical protein D4764_12G0011010 [Takifugu flavidus]